MIPGDEPDKALPITPLWASDPEILRLAMRDDYLSSVPKFLLGLRDMCFHPPSRTPQRRTVEYCGGVVGYSRVLTGRWVHGGTRACAGTGGTRRHRGSSSLARTTT